MAIGSLVAVPELQSEGPARLLRQKPGWLDIRFLRSGAEMTQEAARVVRYCLLPGTRVELASDEGARQGTISAGAPQTDSASGLIRYPVRCDDGTELTADERSIVMVPPAVDPVEQLRTAAFHDQRPRFGRAGAPRPPEPWGPLTFCAREDLLRWRDGAWMNTGGVIALAGARIRPLPHQILTARRVLADRQVRYLLADEVGLGKTIEAGLVMQSLLAMRPQMRVLVVVPGALVSQWFVEMYLKFGGRRFVMYDSNRLEEVRGNPWTEQFVIASSRALETLSGKQALRFAAASWDMVIVDECHRMQPGGSLYKRVAMLSKRAPHVLLLSATPGRQHADSYLALLHLLQPDAYALDDAEGFTRRLAAQGRVLELLLDTRVAREPGQRAEVAAAWVAALPGDPLLAECAQAWAAAAPEAVPAATESLVAHVRENHRLDHRVIRHRRQVLARLSAATGVGGVSLASRTCEWIGYSEDPRGQQLRSTLDAYRAELVRLHRVGEHIAPRLAHWLLQLELGAAAHPRVLERMLAMRGAVLAEPEEYEEYRLRSDPNATLAQVLRPDLSEAETMAHIAVSAACFIDPDEAPLLRALRAAADEACRRVPPRTLALARRIVAFWEDSPDEKVLVFTTSSLAVLEIAEVLGKELGRDRIVTFGAHQDAIEREAAARRFRHEDRCAVMVSDPLGGEGRNFQFVSVIAHHDLPWSVAAVEQRIGRVDRLGRDGEVLSWVLEQEGGADPISAWARILDEAVGVFTASSSGLEFVHDAVEVRSLLTALDAGPEALRAQCAALTALVAAERSERDEREDALYHEGEGIYRRAAEDAAAMVAATVPVRAVCRWLRGMGGAARRDEDAGTHHLRPRGENEWVDGAFDRELALRHEELAFFAPGNELVDGVVADAAAADWCGANAWRVSPDDGCRRWEGVRIAYEFVPDVAGLLATGAPLEAMRRVLARTELARPVRLIRCADGGVETDAAIHARLATAFDPNRGDAVLSPRTSREAWMRPLLGGKPDQVAAWQAKVDRAVAAAVDHADEILCAERERALETLAPALGADVAVARARAEGATARLGRGHQDVERLRDEAAAEVAEVEALLAAIRGAQLRVASAAYIVIA
ncbi:MAG: SNF2-related protein [Planctomycetota bacterium]